MIKRGKSDVSLAINEIKISLNNHVDMIKNLISDENAEILILGAAIEADITELETYEERQMFLEDLGLEEAGVAKLINSAYK